MCDLSQNQKKDLYSAIDVAWWADHLNYSVQFLDACYIKSTVQGEGHKKCKVTKNKKWHF